MYKHCFGGRKGMTLRVLTVIFQFTGPGNLLIQFLPLFTDEAKRIYKDKVTCSRLQVIVQQGLEFRS